MGRRERDHSLARVAVVQQHRLQIRTRDRGASGDLAYVVGFEHIANSVNDVPVEPYTLRVTHIFRRESGEWKIAHRHADYVPIDQTAASEV
jgi:ketosteroid isomerase-like protein